MYECLDAYVVAHPGILPKNFNVSAAMLNIDAFRLDLEELIEKKRVADRVMMIREHAKNAFSNRVPLRQIRLDDSCKDQIRGFIEQIRRALDEADLPASRKQEIISKINALSEEIEKEYSRLDMLGDLWFSATRSLGEGAKNLEPVVRLIERVRKVFSTVQDEGEQRLLTDGGAKKALPAPAEEDQLHS